MLDNYRIFYLKNIYGQVRKSSFNEKMFTDKGEQLFFFSVTLRLLRLLRLLR